MDWRTKFSSIVEETDANIEKLKDKLVSTPSRYKNGSIHGGMYSCSLRDTCNKSMFDSPRNSTDIVQLSSSFNPYLTQNYESSSGMFHDTSTPNVISKLMVDKLDQQSKVIESLTEVVQKMESEREYHKQQVRELRNEISQLNGKFTDSTSDQLVEKRLEQIRRELMGEIKAVQNQLELEASRRSHQPSNSHILAINNDVQKVKYHIQDDIDLVKRDMAVLKSRLSKHEQNLRLHVSSKIDIERRQDELDRSLHDIANRKSPSEKHVLYPVYPSNNKEQLQIQQLKSSISNLQKKLGTVERTINHKDPLTDHHRTYNNSTYVGTKKSHYKGRHNDKKYNRVKDIDVLNGLGESSDEDVASLDIDDLTTSDLLTHVPKQRVPRYDDRDEDEDYDLDDLNLSSDDDFAHDSVLDSDSLNVDDL